MNFDGKSIDLPDAVIEHFRDIKDIVRLGPRADLDIVLIEEEFEDSKDGRKAYHDKVCEKIKRINESKVVFLDPDTGIAPKICEAEHVMSEEVEQIWKSLNQGDILVFYQHKPRFGDWKEFYRSKLAKSCGVNKSQIQMWSADVSWKNAKDVVFYFMQKEK